MATAQGIRAGRAYVELGASMDKLNRDLTQAQQRLNAWSSGARSAMISAFAIATPVALATKTFAEFDDQMRLVQAVTGATGAQFEKLTEQAKELGRTTSWTAAEAAQGMISLGRAGFKSDEIEASIAKLPVLQFSAEASVAEEEAGSIRYYKDEKQTLHVPKRKMSDICFINRIG